MSSPGARAPDQFSAPLITLNIGFVPSLMRIGRVPFGCQSVGTNYLTYSQKKSRNQRLHLLREKKKNLRRRLTCLELLMLVASSLALAEISKSQKGSGQTMKLRKRWFKQTPSAPLTG